MREYCILRLTEHQALPMVPVPRRPFSLRHPVASMEPRPVTTEWRIRCSRHEYGFGVTHQVV